jgi:allophanate hydrolase subunit 2
VPLLAARAPQREERMLPGLNLVPPARVRVLMGPQDDYFTAPALATLLSGTYTLTPACDRMGLRLQGPPLAHAKGYDIVSDGIATGSIQVPGNGQPIVLLADRQTTGGYPKPATVIAADLPGLGRLRPGARIAFEAVDIAAAEAAHRRLAAEIAALAERIVPARPDPAIDAARLMAENLVSGVRDARE